MAMTPTPNPAVRNIPTVEELAPLFQNYELEELVGAGGMGAVYRARHRKLDRHVAIKVLLPDLESDPMFAERFLREARAMARLDHPGIVRVHDFGEADGVFYLVLEYVEGASLRELIGSSRMGPGDALSLVPQICDALQYAHDAGIVHRDVKPENILVDQDGRARIADFGLAKVRDPQTGGVTLTATHQAMGTPHYMAPEQLSSSGAVDHRADLYSLGVVLYEMLTGDLPIGRFSAPSERAPSLAAWDPVVLRSLESEPSKRYQAAEELKREVRSLERAGPVRARATPGGRESRGARVVPARSAGRGFPWTRWSLFSLVLLGCFTRWISAVPIPFRQRSDLEFATSSNAFDVSIKGLPVWTILLGAAALAALDTLRTRRVDVPSGLLIGLALYGCGVTTLLLLVASGVQDLDIGLGGVLCFFAFGCWLVLEIREAWSLQGVAPVESIADRARRERAERTLRPGARPRRTIAVDRNERSQHARQDRTPARADRRTRP